MSDSRSLLTIEAEIESIDDGFIIKTKNSETKETKDIESVREYAEYIVESVNSSLCDDFTAVWKKSPKAKKADIDLIGMQLGMMQEWMDEQLKTNPQES